LWQLDRNTFNHIVKDASQAKRAKYEDFLQSVPILQSIDHYERSKIADTIKEHTYSAGEAVITDGEEGNVFFIIISGEAVATKTLNAGAAPTEVMQYKAGDYFGELALLKSGVREANVNAKTQLKVASIDRDSFKRLLGPLDEILKRNMEAYTKFV
jgi:cAMP-dependent protein kinase regulator